MSRIRRFARPRLSYRSTHEKTRCRNGYMASRLEHLRNSSQANETTSSRLRSDCPVLFMLLAGMLIDSLGPAGRALLAVARVLPIKCVVGTGSRRQFSPAPAGRFAKAAIAKDPDDVCSCSRARLVNSLYDPGRSQSAF